MVSTFRTLLAFGGGYALAVICYVALRAGRTLGRWTLAVLSVPLLAMPLVIPADLRATRLLCACIMAALFSKTLDLHHPRTTLPGTRAYLEFLFNPTSLVVRRLGSEPSRSARENVRRIVRALAQTAAGSLAVYAVYAAHLERWSFALEHAAKIGALYVTVLGVLDALVGLLRLAGQKARDMMGNIFTARTPAEFWRRYNRMVGQFFQEDLFKYAGGLRAPVRATLIVFAASALLHEYVFGVAIGTVQGYQTAFFAVQGLGVAATLRVRPRGAWVVPAILATAVFNLASGVLFITSAQQVIPLFWATAPFVP